MWSVISNWIRLVETGHVEAIINFYILFIKFYKFYVTEQTMTTLHFDKISWIKENKYEYYLDVKLPNEQIPKIVSFVEYNILVESYGEIVPCEIKIISNEWLRIMNDKPFAGNIGLLPKEYIEDIKVDRISQIKDEISEFDKVVEKLYKNGNLNSTAYYIIKDFELALNNIIDYKGGIN